MSENDHEGFAERIRARSDAVSAVRIARDKLVNGEEFEALPSVLHALDQAEHELVAPSSECRLAKPFAPIVQVGDSSGLHYECTHTPPHIF